MGGWCKQGPPPLAAAPPNFLFTAATESQFFLPSHYDHHGNRTGVCSNRLIESDIKLQGWGHQFQDPGAGPASPPGKDRLPSYRWLYPAEGSPGAAGGTASGPLSCFRDSSLSQAAHAYPEQPLPSPAWLCWVRVEVGPRDRAYRKT